MSTSYFKIFVGAKCHTRAIPPYKGLPRPHPITLLHNKDPSLALMAHFREFLPSQSFKLVLKKLNITEADMH